MYEQDADTVHRAFEALAAGGVEAMLPYVHEDFEMTTPAELAAEPDTYLGHDGVRRWFSSFEEVMEEVRLEVVGVEPTGSEDDLLVAFRMYARGRATGLETTQAAFARCRVAEGKAIRLAFFASREQALAAGG